MKRKIFVSIILYVFLFTNMVSYAATPEEVGLYVASYAKNFCDKYSVEYGDNGLYGKISGDKYYSECVSFCRTMYRNAVGYSELQIPVPSGNSHVENNPPDTTAGKRGDNFEMVGYDDLSLAMPGDILEDYHHDFIFVGKVDGNNDIIANNGWNDSNAGLSRGLISLGSHQHSEKNRVNWNGHESMFSGNNGCHFRIWRITSAAAESLGDASAFDPGGDMVEGGNSIASSNSTSSGKNQNSNISNFYYNGLADGKYSVTRNTWDFIVEMFSGIANFLIIFFLWPIRMVFVGWGAIIELIINSTLTAITGGDSIESTNVNTTKVDSGDGISIEKIIFNEIGIFDINFFNFNDEK